MDRHSSITVDEAKSTIKEFLQTLTEKYDCLFDDGTDSEGKAEFIVIAKGSNVRVWFDEDKQLYGFDQTDGKGSKNNADFDLLKPVLDSYIHIQVSLLPVANMIADEYKDSIGKEISKGKVGGKSATGYRVMYRVAGVTDSVLIVRNLKDNIYVLEVTECFKKEDGKMGMGDVLETYTYEVDGDSIKEISDVEDSDVSVEDSDVSVEDSGTGTEAVETVEADVEDSELAVEEPVKHKTILESLVEKEYDEDITYKDGKAFVDSDIAELVIADKGDWAVFESGTQYKGLYKLAKSVTVPISESDSLFKLIMGVLDTPNNWVVSNEVFSSILENTGAILDEDRLVLDGKILGKAVIDNDTLIIGEEVIPSLEYFKDFYNLGVSETEANDVEEIEVAEESEEPVEESAGADEESTGDVEGLDEPVEESAGDVEADETDVTVESEEETFDMEEPVEEIETEGITESEEPTEVVEEPSEEVADTFDEIAESTEEVVDTLDEVIESDESDEFSEEVAEEIAESTEEVTDIFEETATSDSSEESTDIESSEVVTEDATKPNLGVVETEVEDNNAGGSSMIEVKVNEVPVSTGTQVKNFSDETGKEFVRIVKDGQIYDISAEVAERFGVRQNRIGSRTELINKYGVLLDPDEFGLKTVTTVVSDDDEDKIAELIYSLFE